MATPSGSIELAHIWQLLRQMQEQEVSLQESVTTFRNNVLDIEESVGVIKTTTSRISEQLDQLEQGPQTTQVKPQGAAETLRSPQTLHWPVASKPYERPSLLGPPTMGGMRFLGHRGQESA